VDTASLQILDRAMRGGGENLTKSVAGKGAEAAARLEALSAEGYFEKKKTKYALTEKGRRACEKGQRLLRNEALVEFLAAVEKKQGKAFTAKELSKYPDDVRNEAVAKTLVEDNEKPNTFKLMSAGKATLLAREPLEKQVAALRELQQQASELWDAGLKRVEQELKGLDRDGTGGIAASLRERVRQARSEYESAIEELRVFDVLAGASQRLQEQITQASQEALREVQTREEQVRGIAAELRSQADTYRQQLDAHIAALKERLRQAASERIEARADSSIPPTPSEEQLLEATGEAYDRLHKANLRLGGIVKIPELYDEIRQRVPGLDLTKFHDRLLKWRDEDRLVLQVCNNPDAEPRAKEGIETSKGLLFYVRMG